MAEKTASRSVAVQADAPADRSAGLQLFAPGGTFACYPGPVLLVGHNGIVLSHNDAGEALSRLLQGDHAAQLRDAVQVAIEGHAAQINPLILEADESLGTAQQSFDLTVLPWAQGTAALMIARDTTLERSLRGALIDSRQRFKDLADLAADFSWETDRTGRFVYLSDDSLLGSPATDFLGQEADGFLVERPADGVSLFTAKEPYHDRQVWLRSAEGQEVCLSLSARPLYDEQGVWVGTRGLSRDVSQDEESEQRQAQLRLRNRLLGYVLQLMRAEVEPLRMLTAAVEALVPAISVDGAVLLRKGEDEELAIQVLAGTPLPKPLLEGVLKAARDSSASEASLEDRAGRAFALSREKGPASAVLAVWRAPGRQACDATEREFLAAVIEEVGQVIERLVRESALEQLSATDPLTGLLNRRGFLQNLEEQISQVATTEPGGALFYIDLDNFKAVNDTKGHQAGDALLARVANCLREHIRNDDLAGRLGGDEFAVYLGRISPVVAEQKALLLIKSAQRLSEEFADPNKPLGFSIGVALHRADSKESIESLIERADGAMYEAKRGGKGRHKLSDPAKRPGSGNARPGNASDVT